MSLSKVLILIFVSTLSYSSFLPNSFKVQLTEEIKKNGKRESRKSVKDFSYKYPGKVKFVMENMTVISNKKRLWMYWPSVIAGEPGDVKVEDGNSNQMLKIFEALRNGLKSNSFYSVKNQGSQNYFLDFTEKGVSELKVKSIVLSFNSSRLQFGDLSKMALTYTDGSLMDLYLNSLNTKVKFDDSYFVFKVPAGTKYI